MLGLPNDALYTAFRIECEFTDESGHKTDTSGTGFFMSFQEFVFFVTNRHCIDLNYPRPHYKYKSSRLSRIRLSGRFNSESIQKGLIAVTSTKIHIPRNELNDICCIMKPSLVIEGNIPSNGIDFYINERMIAKKSDFENEMNVCDFVGFTGYPEWHDQVNIRPLFRVGTIASDPRFDYSDTRAKGNCIAYEAFSFGGSSGSPVFSFAKRALTNPFVVSPPKFIGINAGHYDSPSHRHSGISYFYKSTAIAEMLSECIEEYTMKYHNVTDLDLPPESSSH